MKLNNMRFKILMIHKGQLVGYIRVSSDDQNPERQLEELEVHKTFIEYASGGTKNRPELHKLLGYVREGDTIIVHSLDRLARNLDDLRSLVRDITARQITIKFIKENLTFSPDTTDPMAIFLLSVIGAVAEFERSLIRERQREGIALAKKKGVYVGGKKKLTDEQVEMIKTNLKNGFSVKHITREFKISRPTLYRYLKGFKFEKTY